MLLACTRRRASCSSIIFVPQQNFRRIYSLILEKKRGANAKRCHAHPPAYRRQGYPMLVTPIIGFIGLAFRQNRKPEHVDASGDDRGKGADGVSRGPCTSPSKR